MIEQGMYFAYKKKKTHNIFTFWYIYNQQNINNHFLFSRNDVNVVNEFFYQT